MTGLKPCPFCGEKASVINASPLHPKLFAVGCDGKYGSNCPGYVWKIAPLYYTRQQAIDAWNRRAKDGEQE